jgi:hypothetical protein
MRAAVVLVLLAVLVVTAGCGGHNRSTRSRVQVRITLTSWSSNRKHTEGFTLGCEPISGTLPLAVRVCGDIARHPTAMLDPPKRRWTCSGSPFMPQLTILSTRQGEKASFGGSPGCDWPGGTALTIYWAASRHDPRILNLAEPRLRCDDDATLLATPTPRASAVACVHGLWTPRSERLIRTAKQAPELAGLAPATLFPADVGARNCAIPAGGHTRRRLHGTCAVTVTHTGSKPIVTFVEDWPRTGGGILRHRWHVRVTGSKATDVSQTGPPAPQQWK